MKVVGGVSRSPAMDSQDVKSTDKLSSDYLLDITSAILPLPTDPRYQLILPVNSYAAGCYPGIIPPTGPEFLPPVLVMPHQPTAS